MDDKLRTDDKHRVVARLLDKPVCIKCGCVIVNVLGQHKLRVISDTHYSKCGREDCEMM